MPLLVVLLVRLLAIELFDIMVNHLLPPVDNHIDLLPESGLFPSLTKMFFHVNGVVEQRNRVIEGPVIFNVHIALEW